MTTAAEANTYMTQDDRERAAAVGEAALQITGYMPVQIFEGRNGQKRREYREQLIVVKHSQEANTIAVDARIGEALRTVYYADVDDKHNPHQFNQGRWIDYIYTLANRAMRARVEREAKRDSERFENRGFLYSAVDDEDHFGPLIETD